MAKARSSSTTAAAQPSAAPSDPGAVAGAPDWADKAGPSKQVAATEQAEGLVYADPRVAVPQPPVQLLIKRLFDIGFSLVCLVLGAPFLLVLAAAVKFDSPGPALYRQVRVGRGGKPFPILKFRSMVVDAERHGPRWARSQDTRVTKVGGFLRRTSMDELPQIWNVLMGDMSWIGPRPERPVFVARFRLQIEDYDARHTMRPGLSGWAQVNGMRGNVSIEERTRFDVHYVRHFSLWLDFICFFRTFSVLAGD